MFFRCRAALSGRKLKLCANTNTHTHTCERARGEAALEINIESSFVGEIARARAPIQLIATRKYIDARRRRLDSTNNRSADSDIDVNRASDGANFTQDNLDGVVTRAGEWL